MNNIYTQSAGDASTESIALVNDTTFRFTAEKLVLKCGVRADLKGFKCLVDAVILYGTEYKTAFCELYREIGAIRGLKQKTVMREIAYALSQAFILPERLSAMIGVPISPADVHNGLVIAYIAKLFKNPSLSDMS